MKKTKNRQNESTFDESKKNWEIKLLNKIEKIE